MLNDSRPCGNCRCRLDAEWSAALGFCRSWRLKSAVAGRARFFRGVWPAVFGKRAAQSLVNKHSRTGAAKICVLLCPLDQGSRLGPISAWRAHYADAVACGFNERSVANLRYDRIGRCEDVDKAHAEPAHIGYVASRHRVQRNPMHASDIGQLNALFRSDSAKGPREP